MAIANGTCVSFCNQPKAQVGYLRRVTPVCRCLHSFCGSRHLATARESKAHFGLPWVQPWDNRGKCHMDENEDSMLVKRIAACMIMMYPSIFNRLRAIARYLSEIATFPTPLHLTPPLGCSHYKLSRFDTLPACDGETDR